MKKIHYVAIGIAALVLVSYVAFSWNVFFHEDSGTSTEAGRTGAEDAEESEASPVAITGLQDLPGVYERIMEHAVAGEYDAMVTAVNDTFDGLPEVPPDQQAKLLYFRGFANYQLSLPDQAIPDLSSALEIEPANVNALNFRGQAYIATGQFDLAIDDANQLLELVPESADGYLVRGMAHLQSGDHEEAELDATSALELDPESAMGALLLELIQTAEEAAEVDEVPGADSSPTSS